MVDQNDTHNAPSRSLASWQNGFLELLPAIVKQLRYAFRKLPYGERCEAIQEATAYAVLAYQRLVQLGRQNLAYATPLAQYAVKRVRAGRQVGGRLNIKDVLSPYCRQRTGVQVQPLLERDRRTGCWRELLIEDRHASPADLAAIKLDFQDWLGSLAPKKRALTETLASGESTSQVARLFRVSAARVSQLRRELHSLWQHFQGELDPPHVAVA